jgi:hypothetical protein
MKTGKREAHFPVLIRSSHPSTATDPKGNNKTTGPRSKGVSLPIGSSGQISVKKPRKGKNEGNSRISASEGLIHDRETYFQAKNEMRMVLDKSVLTFSGGAFGLSITFISQLAENPGLSKWLLFGSWLFFLFSILVTLYGFRVSEKAHDDVIARIDSGIESREKEADLRKNLKERIDKSNNCIKILNFFSIAFFSLGCFALMLFVGFNI